MIKHIIKVKKDTLAAQAQRAANSTKIKQLEDILANKQLEKLSNSSAEDIQKQIDQLKA